MPASAAVVLLNENSPVTSNALLSMTIKWIPPELSLFLTTIIGLPLLSQRTFLVTSAPSILTVIDLKLA